VNLFEVPALVLPESRAAPRWARGCFFRRAITFFNGATDTTTLVVWIQSRALPFDLRLAPGRPRPRDLEELRRLPLEDVVRLAEAEGGLAESTFQARPTATSGSMNWGGWVRAQVHDGWPEPGELRRVGDCLTEFAPSGAYVEDWRAQRSSPGMLVGLVLLTEKDARTGAVLHAGGGLVVAGDHAGFVRGRPTALPAFPHLVDCVRAADGARERWDDVFRFEASYATRSASGDYVVAASTLPFREGRRLISLDGFTVDGDLVVQRATEDGVDIERRFRLETCEPYDGERATSAAPAAQSWLDAEASTLLRNAR
jgi:hypothetical protein